jgi:hypothetical protein
MPRSLTDKVAERQYLILEFIKSEICINTRQVSERFGLTHSQVFYVLQTLQKQGLVEEYIIGRLSIWCAQGQLLNDVYVGDMFISAFELERAICKILENAKGHKLTIRVSWVADKIAENMQINARHPLLLAYISEMLPIMLNNVKKTAFRDSKGSEFYVVDTCSICEHFYECPTCEMLRKKLNC